MYEGLPRTDEASQTWDNGSRSSGTGVVFGQKNAPSDLPPCPTAASMLSGLAVEPILDILSDRL